MEFLIKFCALLFLVGAIVLLVCGAFQVFMDLFEEWTRDQRWFGVVLIAFLMLVVLLCICMARSLAIDLFGGAA